MSDTQSGTEYLFAYGTLQPGRTPEEVADLVRRFESVGKGTVGGTLYDLGSYPGAVLDDTSPHRISGTVFSLPASDDVLSRLDHYEGFDPQAPKASLFIRRLHPVKLDGGVTLRCWIYEYNGALDRARIIESGEFCK